MRTRRMRESGVSTVEFAFVGPLFFAILFVIFELGRAFCQWQIVQHAVIDGIEYGVQGIDFSKIEPRARGRIMDRLSGIVPITAADIQVIVPGDITNPVRVTARTQFNSPLDPFFAFLGLTTASQLTNAATSWYNATRTDRVNPIPIARYNPPSTPTDIYATTPAAPSSPSSPGNPTTDPSSSTMPTTTAATTAPTTTPTTNPVLGSTNPTGYTTASGSSVNYVDLR